MGDMDVGEFIVPVPLVKQVKEVVQGQGQGLRDDTTCIVIDILPPEKITPSAPTKKSGIRVFKNMFHRKSSEPFSLADRDSVETNVLEELFEGESAFLSQRLNTTNPIHSLFKLCICAICQINI